MSSSSTYVYARILFLRGLGFVYGVAFLIAYRQNKALIGDEGITPARGVLDKADIRARCAKENREKKKQAGQAGNRRLIHEVIWDQIRSIYFTLWDRKDEEHHIILTVLWLARNRSKLNKWLDSIAIIGILASSLVLIGYESLWLLLTLWICQRSLWAVGGTWYAYRYGWEHLLAETGFYSLFMTTTSPFSGFATTMVDVPMELIWSIRWFLFRIMFGAGLTKLKGGKIWKNLSAMCYFYETQPIPNTFSRCFHWAPSWWHNFETAASLGLELVVPWCLLIPFRQTLMMSGILLAAFQMMLIISANLSYLNWLTILPILFCFDDDFFVATFNLSPMPSTKRGYEFSNLFNASCHILLGVSIVILSVPHVRNFFASSSSYKMIGSFDSFQIMNAFGAFGSVSEERIELIVTSSLDGKLWKEYEFIVKPGNTQRSPGLLSPYHYRLDWQMWIAAQYPTIYASSPWMYRFLIKLLEADPTVLKALMSKDPWDGQKPTYRRVEKYRYKFSTTGQDYWSREHIGRFYPRIGIGATLPTLWRQVDRQA